MRENRIWNQIKGFAAPAICGTAVLLGACTGRQGAMAETLDAGISGEILQQEEGKPEEDILEDGENNWETPSDFADSAGRIDVESVSLSAEKENTEFNQNLNFESNLESEEIFTPDKTDEEETAGFVMSMKADADILKAGEPAVYEIQLTNTGTLPITDLLLTSVFSCPKVTQEWQPAVNLTVNGNTALLALLEPAQTMILYLTAQLTPEQSNPLTHTVTAAAGNPKNETETLERTEIVESEVQPLKVDFSVYKTADRSVALPGDIVTYQICIQNTGERTLHSVVGTERFLNSGLQAKFREKEGITLNETRDKAMIAEIAPGESVTLVAEVTIPENEVSQELINQVTVLTAETGEKTITSQALVRVEAPIPTETPVPANILQESEIPYQEAQAAITLSNTPKTADTSRWEFFAALTAAALVCAVLSFARRAISGRAS